MKWLIRWMRGKYARQRFGAANDPDLIKARRKQQQIRERLKILGLEAELARREHREPAP